MPTHNSLTPAQQHSLNAMEKELNALLDRLQDGFVKRTDTMLVELLNRHGRQFAVLLDGLLKQSFEATVVGGTPTASRGGFMPSTIQNLSGLWQELQRAQRNL